MLCPPQAVLGEPEDTALAVGLREVICALPHRSCSGNTRQHHWGHLASVSTETYTGTISPHASTAFI